MIVSMLVPKSRITIRTRLSKINQFLNPPDRLPLICMCSFKNTYRYIYSRFSIKHFSSVNFFFNLKAVNKAAGQNLETMRRVTWDTSSYKGKLARIRLIDKSSESWGHINFDDLTGDFECAPGL